MSNYKEGLDSILQAINNLITPQLVSLKYDKTFRGKITSIIDNGLYEVQVNGRSYTLPYAGTLQVGDIVKVKSPLNNFSDIYIEAIGGSGGGSTTTDYNDLTSKPILNTNYTSSLSPDSSEIIKGTIGLHKISKTGKYSDLIGTPDLDFIPNSEKGVAGGVATLDENSKLPTSQLPGGIVTDPNYVHTDNNFTNALLTKLNGIESGAQVNKIESISKNGEALTITNKNVNIEVPTKLSELENDNNTVTDKDYVHTDNNFTNALLTKLNGIESGAEVNAIAGIKTNGVLQPIVNKIVDISIPTKTSQLTNDGSDGTNPFISEIPIASSTQLGGIKVGNNLSIEADGTLNASEGGVKSYNDLTDKPVLNTNVSTSQPVSEGETITGEIVLHKISKTGSYNDLLDKPTIPEPSNEVEISQTQPTDTEVELWVDLSENPSGGGQKTYKYKMSGSPMKEVLPGGKITLPCTYKVGAGVLDIYFNGELLILSADASGSNGHYLEVGTTGSISNEIQLTSDWGTGTDYYLAIVVRGEYIATPSLITFTLGDYQCQAEEGMTFGTWANSTYNVDNKFYISDTKPYYLFDETNRRYLDNLEDGSQDFVAKDTIIVANKTYPVYVGGPIK